MLQLQLEKLEAMNKSGKASSAALLRAKISGELENYHGEMREELEKRLKAVPAPQGKFKSRR